MREFGSGPFTDTLVQQQASPTSRIAEIDFEDLSATAAFTNPAESSGVPWDYGFAFHPIDNAVQVVTVDSAGFWHFNGYPDANIAGSGMRRYRLTASVLHSRMPPSPRRRLSAYGGGGAGLYFYRFPDRPNGGAWGIHGVMGAEYLLRTMRSRWVAGGEVQVHAMGQPKGPDSPSSIPMLSAHVSVLVKYRLP